MTTLLNADLPSDSDPDDGDYEESSDGDARLAEPRRRDAARCLSRSRSLSVRQAGSSRRVDKLWEAAQADAQAVASKRPPLVPLDALSKQFHRRNPRAPKQRSRSHVLSEIAKFCTVVADDAPPPPRARDVKRDVRSAAASARAAIAASATRAAARLQPLTTVVESTVRFAGEEVRVQRVVPAGTEGQAAGLKRRKGGHAAFDRFLGMQEPAKEVNVMDKTDLDWQAHKHNSKLADLEKDPHAGALERREFLDRVAARGDNIADNARRDAARQAARVAKAKEKES